MSYVSLEGGFLFKREQPDTRTLISGLSRNGRYKSNALQEQQMAVRWGNAITFNAVQKCIIRSVSSPNWEIKLEGSKNLPDQDEASTEASGEPQKLTKSINDVIIQHKEKQNPGLSKTRTVKWENHESVANALALSKGGHK